VKTVDRDASVTREATAARRALKALARPAGQFDASRYFRGTRHLGFYNVRTTEIRRLARDVAGRHAADWSIDEAQAFASALIADRFLEAKGIGLETLARFRRQFTPALLPVWKRWLSANHADNWATTDVMCGALISPLLLAHPELVPEIRRWPRHRNLWVRRASAVSLVPLARRGLALNEAYATARELGRFPEDLVHKAAGWLLREAGKADRDRLERFLRAEGATLPRTTVRYALERFPARKRRRLLLATRPAA
jgi:3-methyladenine DNA glycosylase AlkD